MFDGLKSKITFDRATAPFLVVAGVLIITSLVLRANFLSFVSGDSHSFVQPWIITLQEKGFSAFGTAFYNYNPPYLYVLYLFKDFGFGIAIWIEKFVSLLFDLSLVGAVMGIVWQMRRHLGLTVLSGAIVFALPEVILNSGIWGQVDAGWSMLVVWGIFCLMRGKYLPAWIIFGCALAFKSQAAFVLPAFIILFFLQKHKWWHVLAGVGAFFVWYAPALLAGRSFISLISIYVKQTGAMQVLSADAPNFYTFIPNSLFDAVQPIGILGAVVIIIIAAIFATRHLRRKTIDALDVLKLFLLFALLSPSLLPQMHERYFYLAAIIALLVAFTDRRFTVVAILIQLANTIACLGLFMNSGNAQEPKLDYDQWHFLIIPAAGLEILAVLLCLVFLFKPISKPVPLLYPSRGQQLELHQPISRN